MRSNSNFFNRIKAIIIWFLLIPILLLGIFLLFRGPVVQPAQQSVASMILIGIFVLIMLWLLSVLWKNLSGNKWKTFTGFLKSFGNIILKTLKITMIIALFTMIIIGIAFWINPDGVRDLADEAGVENLFPVKKVVKNVQRPVVRTQKEVIYKRLVLAANGRKSESILATRLLVWNITEGCARVHLSNRQDYTKCSTMPDKNVGIGLNTKISFSGLGSGAKVLLTFK